MTLTLGDGILWLESQPDNSLDGIFTDPPWGVMSIEIEGQAQWKDLLARLLRASARVVKPSGHILIWYSQPQLDPVIRQIVASPLFLNALIVVQHGGSVMIPLDFIYCLAREHRSLKLHSWVLVADTFQDGERRHPAERPQNIVSRVLREWFRPGDKIADPFAGSNTTGWAAERIGIDCFSFEIDPIMYATALDRDKQIDLFTKKGEA